MAALGICRRNLLNRILRRSGKLSCRTVKTTEGKKESNEPCPPPDSVYKKVPDFSKPLQNKNWVSFGFDERNRDDDLYLMHLSFFVLITVCMCGIGFIWIYYPDRNHDDWARREAFIRLYEREQLGLDPIDMNYVDPSKIVLPADEDIGEDEIIL